MVGHALEDVQTIGVSGPWLGIMCHVFPTSDRVLSRMLFKPSALGNPRPRKKCRFERLVHKVQWSGHGDPSRMHHPVVGT